MRPGFPRDSIGIALLAGLLPTLQWGCEPLRGSRGQVELCCHEAVVCPAPRPSWIGLSQYRVAPGGLLRARYLATSWLAHDAWIGIVPSRVRHGSERLNDLHDVCYRYLHGRQHGQVVLRAPNRPGRYDLRLNDTDLNGRELASVSFVVTAPAWWRALERQPPELWLSRYQVAPGELLSVRYRARPSYASDAWIGLLPGWVPHGQEAVNDRYDLAYRYLGRRYRGVLTFRAPLAPGRYDVRMHDTDQNGREVASASFTVLRSCRRASLRCY